MNMVIMKNTNLEQALEMSLFTWLIAVLLGVIIVILEKVFQRSKTSKQNLYQLALLILAPYTILTGCMWLYYFTLVLCLPFYALQLFFVWKLYLLKPKRNIFLMIVGMTFLTLFTSFLSALFFDVI